MKIIYLDENFSHRIAAALNCIEDIEGKIEVRSTELVFGKGVKDPNLVPLLTKDCCLITKDADFKRQQILTTLISRHGIGVFHFKPPNNSNHWDQIKFLIRAYPDLRKIVLKEKPPYLYAIRVNGKIERLEL
jgi:predicted nuclease of predicted toxin-antitoxin system